MSYSVELKSCCRSKGKKEILHNLNGYVEHGQLLAILGSSGAGKTTFLDILAGRSKSGVVRGDVFVNGQQQDRNFKKLSGYVTQDDALMATQTVEETLSFYAKLKLPTSTTSRQRKDRVDEIITELGLSKVKKSRVGSQFKRGVSGGERKRVSIGSELITDPSVLFLDEPTTGLDSYNSLAVMSVLADLAKAGRTVVATIHQPRSTIFDLFDRLLILSEGQTVYFGKASDAKAYFNGLHYSIKDNINPADAILDIVVKKERDMSTHDFIGSNPSSPPDVNGDIDNSSLADTYIKSDVWKNSESRISHLNSKIGGTNFVFPKTPNWFVKTAMLIKRNYVNVFRTPQTSFVQLFQTIFMAVLVGTIFFQIKDNQGSIQDRVGCLFFIITNTAFSQFSALALFLEERNLFNRERAGGLYGTFGYFVSKNLLDLTWIIIFPAVSSSILYYMVGLQPAPDKFGIFVAVLVMFTLAATSIFLTIGAVSPNLQAAQILSPVTLVLLLLFGGFYINNDNVPVYYAWIHYVTPFRYAYEALMYNEFSGLTFSPDTVNVNGTLVNVTDNFIPTGEAQLARMGMANINIWTHLAVLAGTICTLRIVALVALCTLYKEKR